MKLALPDRRVPKAKGLWASNDYVIESCLGEETYKGTRTYGRVPGDMRDMTRRSRISHARRRASLPPALSPLILVLAALPLATLPLNVGHGRHSAPMSLHHIRKAAVRPEEET